MTRRTNSGASSGNDLRPAARHDRRNLNLLKWRQSVLFTALENSSGSWPALVRIGLAHFASLLYMLYRCLTERGDGEEGGFAARVLTRAPRPTSRDLRGIDDKEGG